MLVAYSVTTCSTHSGTIDLDPDEVDKLNKLPEIEQGTLIMDKINWGDDSTREYRSVECVSYFEPV